MRETIHLKDSESRQLVEASIFDEVTLDHFLQTQATWRPIVLEAARAMAKDPARAMLIPRHYHWDWTRKEAELKMLALKFFGIECQNRLQGIMKIDTVARSCRLP